MIQIIPADETTDYFCGDIAIESKKTVLIIENEKGKTSFFRRLLNLLHWHKSGKCSNDVWHVLTNDKNPSIKSGDIIELEVEQYLHPSEWFIVKNAEEDHAQTKLDT